MIPIDPATLRRLERQWRDREVLTEDVRKQFHLSAGDVRKLNALWGERQRFQPMAWRGIGRQSRAEERRRRGLAP